MMKTIVATLFFLCLFLGAAAFVVPGFIDWNVHKGEIVRQLSSNFQRKIDVQGNISLKLLPQPEVMLENVTMENAAGAKLPQLVTLRQVGGRLKLRSLFEGRIEVESLELLDPVINMEVLADGKSGWLGVLQEQSAHAIGSAASAIQLNRVTVTNGTLVYLNQSTGSTWRIQNMNLTVAADTLRGPYNVNGSMKFRDQTVAVELKTEKYDGQTPVPTVLAFLPAADMPQVKLNGVTDFKTGLDFQGELSIDKGSLGDLFNNVTLKKLKFMNDAVDLKGVMELKGEQLTLSDMKAKFGEKGSLRGRLVMQLSRTGKPAVVLDVQAENLTVISKEEDAYVEVPDSFFATIRAKGKNIGWDGAILSAVDMNVETAAKEWKIKSLNLELPGPSQIKLSGTMTPLSDSAALNMQLTTADLPKLITSRAPAETNSLKLLADAAVVKKLAMTSGLNISQAQISFFNIDATAEDKMKASGVLSIDRMASRPAFSAKMTFNDWVIADGGADFLRKVMTADADIEVTAVNLTKETTQLSELTLKGTLAEQGVSLNYVVKAEHAEGALLPPLFPVWNNANIEGSVMGTPEMHTFDVQGTVNGGEIELAGRNDAGVYQMTWGLKDTNAANALALINLPIMGLTGDGGAVDFSGTLSGTRDDYKTEKANLQFGDVTLSGGFEKKGDVRSADLTVAKVDIDKWLSGEWNVKDPVTLKLRAAEMNWHGQTIKDAQVQAEAGPANVKMTGLKGKIFNGSLNAEDTRTRSDKVWSSVFKGQVEGADLASLAAKIGLKGVTPGTGTIDFDMTTASGLGGATGSVALKMESLRIEKFNFDKLGEEVDALIAVPKDTQKFVMDSLHKDATIFSNVTVKAKVAAGDMRMNGLKLINNAGDLTVNGELNAKDGSYQMSGDLHLVKPEDFPALKIRRTSDMADYKIDTTEVGQYIIKSIPPPLEVQPDVGVVPSAAIALPPEKKENNSAVPDILKRLDEEPAPAVAPAPTPEPRAAEPEASAPLPPIPETVIIP